MFLRRWNKEECIVETDEAEKHDTEKLVGKTELLCEKREDLHQALNQKLIPI